MQRLMVVVMGWLLVSASWAQAPVSPQGDGARQLWQLMDYVAVDYGGAVVDGAIASESEYAEMKDFAENAAKQAASLPDQTDKPALIAAVGALRRAVLGKASSKEVASLAHQANAVLLKAYPIPVAPKAPPDLKAGAALFSAQCAACHGASGNGDGPLAAKLEPKPIAFTDQARANSRSVLALYQAVSQGVGGTSMPSFDSLPEADRWALAFYAGTLSHDGAEEAHGKAMLASNAALKSRFPDLAAVTTITTAALAETIPLQDARAVTAYLRSHLEAVAGNAPGSLALARNRLADSLAAARAGDLSSATRLGLSAYLDGFEPLEPTVGSRNKELLAEVEAGMLAYRAAVASSDIAKAEATALQLDRLFARVEAELGAGTADPVTTYLGSLTILLREGVEALLIVVGMLAFLKKANRPDVAKRVHAGWITALAAGGLTWVMATYVVSISGADREVTEGVSSVFAAIVLLSVGLWMHQKSAAGRWQAYLQEKLTSALSVRSAWALFALSFIAVYREVFETVLFYSALAAEGNNGALLAGLLTGIAGLAVIAWLLLRTSARMPIGKFFSYSSILVAVLAVVLIGKGAAALQEAGWLGVSPMHWPRIDILGMYPTIQTTAAQILVLLIALSGFWINSMKARQPQVS